MTILLHFNDWQELWPIRSQSWIFSAQWECFYSDVPGLCLCGCGADSCKFVLFVDDGMDLELVLNGPALSPHCRKCRVVYTSHVSGCACGFLNYTHSSATRELYCTSGVWRDPSSCEDESWVRMRLVYAKIWLLCFYCNAIYHFGYWDRNIQAVVLHNCLTIVELARFL